MKRLLWWLIAGTKGGINRAKIIMILKERPYNANQLTEKLKLDYKTVQHHLKVLIKNDIITSPRGKKYGAMYFLSDLMETHYEIFREIWDQIGKK
ncbi:MAG: winged helix-turn-helix domain-containing protein [Candidatus Thermoplasmatota archaeon]|jgi:DNA-binding transcriptional ArsR family regulator|nr:winged helix-turn-helix domain-containing protein [Candidatus Thermoplasmatota archaeon]MDP7265687.1 winged helix-turn-helix domain-containing protein [Candidatus Thermoplasmatota archaeon]